MDRGTRRWNPWRALRRRPDVTVVRGTRLSGYGFRLYTVQLVTGSKSKAIGVFIALVFGLILLL